jgi:hypothetical protein
MIIELFGPPGAGKTTLSRALATRLREHGHLAELRLSYRPTERQAALDLRLASAKRHRNVVMHRLTRPLAEVLAIMRRPFGNARDVKTAAHLVSLLPPTSIFASIKNGQYLLRLSHSWREKCGVAHVVLFDQAFVQAVCSLALLTRVADDTLIGNALDYAPKSDLLIRLVAPFEILRGRQNDRRSLQSTMEQLFEPDPKTSLASVPMFDRLHDLLLQRGRCVLSASSVDPRSLDESVDMISREVTSRLLKNSEKQSSATKESSVLLF